MRTLIKSFAVACSLLAAPFCQASQALQVNFGNSYVPDPGGGLLQSFPSSSLTGSGFNVWNHLRVGVYERFSFGVDGAFLGGPTNNFNSSNLYVDYRPEAFLPDLGIRMSPFIGLMSGTAGSTGGGMLGYFDWKLADALTLYTSPGYVYSSAASSAHRFKLDMALDYRVLPWLSIDAELLTGAPHWNFGPDTLLGLAPGATFYVGQATLQGSLIFPVAKTSSAATLANPSIATGVSYAW